MIRNYLLIAWRNILKRKGFSFINIFGLALGISICMLILLYLRHETTYDRFVPESGQVYRMVLDRIYPGRSTSYAIIPSSYAAAVKAECGEVMEVTRFFDFLGGGTIQLKYGDQRFEEKRMLNVDSTFFKVFIHPFVAGDIQTALDEPNSAVMTETTAKRYFGGATNAIGKMIQPEGVNNPPIKITGVCQDWPDHSHFTFDILLSTVQNPALKQENYTGFQAFTYLKLKPHAVPGKVEAKFPEIIKKYAAGNIAKTFAMPYDAFFKAGNGYRYYLQPLSMIHLISHLDAEFSPNGSMQSVYIFSVIAFIILLLAIINFVNLATARSNERAKEVGIRKTFGSEKKSLFIQFMSESMLISLLSFLMAIGLCYVFVPYFKKFSGAQLSFSSLFNGSNFLLFIVLVLISGLLAGTYPSLVLSSFEPIKVLKGKFVNTGFGTRMRSALVVFQFSISIILIVCTIIVNHQMMYMTGNNLGYNKDQVIILNRTDLLKDHTKAFNESLVSSALVKKVSGSSAFPTNGNFFGTSWRKPGDDHPMTGKGIITDDQYASTFELQQSSGRYFSKEFSTDSLALVLNEAAVRELNLQDPLGASLTSEDAFLNGPKGQPYTYHVVGVVKDFNYESLHSKITPLIFINATLFKGQVPFEAIKLQKGSINDGIQFVQKVWGQYVPDRPFTFDFLDKNIALQYDVEIKLQRIFNFFSFAAILIACLGLLGLASYACQQRMKEISIRKVLGASSSGIMTLLSIKFIKSIIIAILIAFPAAWVIMHYWLQSFSYRVLISPLSFIIAAGLSLGLAVVTLSFQTIRAAWTNPIKSLRAE